VSAPARILIVDDDRDLVAALTLALEGRGFTVLAAHDAASGQALAEAERPDLILLDVMMPSATEGFHFVWQLRRRDEAYFNEVPILIISAIHQQTQLRFYPESSDGTYRAGEFLPVQGFIDKPIDPEELIARVAHALELARPR
jgi:DNA-binding response OmpR family regulator